MEDAESGAMARQLCRIVVSLNELQYDSVGRRIFSRLCCERLKKEPLFLCVERQWGLGFVTARLSSSFVVKYLD